MCWYVLREALCSHHGPELFSGPSCAVLLNQLNRIHSPSAWGTAEAEAEAEASIPFDWPDTCEPTSNNTVTVRMWCGWECRNTFDPMGEVEATGGRYSPAGGYQQRMQFGGIVGVGLGMVEAKYGQPRLGVGWRE